MALAQYVGSCCDKRYWRAWQIT